MDYKNLKDKKMKNLLKLLLGVGIIFSGCSKFVEDYDVSPNNPSEVSAPLLLTNAEVALFATHSGQLARTTSILTQSLSGTDAQMIDVEQYRVLEGDNVNEWEVIYTDGLEACQDIINNYGENTHYLGIAKILKAMFLGVATDLWGDIPSSEALRGKANLSPKYDVQQTVIAQIQSLLGEGIGHLNASVDGLSPDSDDIIYGGDVSAWVTVAYVLKARYAVRINQTPGNTGNSDAISALNAAAMTSSDQDMNMIFGSAGNEQNQWSAFDIARPGYVRLGKPFVDGLIANSDPRLPFYANKDTGNIIYRGAIIGAGDQTASPIGSYLKGITFPLVSCVEAKFLEAEAKFATDKSGSASAYNDAVKASVLQVTGSADAGFEAAYASETDATISLDKIHSQKYIALFGQVEAYSNWRRTGVPSLTPNPSGSTSVIPVRLPTPLDERLYNKNATVVSDITQPVWWDQ